MQRLSIGVGRSPFRKLCRELYTLRGSLRSCNFMTENSRFDASSPEKATSKSPEILGAPDETENAREAASRPEKGHLESLDCQAQPSPSPPQSSPLSSPSNALQLVRTFVPDETRQLQALRLLADAPEVPES